MSARPEASNAPCAECQGEGVRFVAREGRAVAVACVCTQACPKCGGAGRLYQQDARGYTQLAGCDCGADPRRLAILSGLRIPVKFMGAKTSTYQPKNSEQAKAQARAVRFIEEFMPNASGGRGILFLGQPGTGKTHLLLSILRELALQKGVRGRYEEFSLLLSDIKDGFSKGLSTREWLEPLRQVDVLAIDEVGKGTSRNVEFEQGVLDEIISVRYNAGRPTLLASNYPRAGSLWKFPEVGVPETLEHRVGPRIYSRLHELCDFVEVTGEDHRKQQHEERERAPQARRGLPPGSARTARLGGK
ncbi:MAG: ATP-binding protein [Deltaproteobacteria bacterium]|nr:ATP-binding protein [Deltaproteobacteria bacterium]